MQIMLRPPAGYDEESARHDKVEWSGTPFPPAKITFEPCVGHLIVQIFIAHSHSYPHPMEAVQERVNSREQAQALLDQYLARPIESIQPALPDRFLKYVIAPKTVMDMTDQDVCCAWVLFSPKDQPASSR